MFEFVLYMGMIERVSSLSKFYVYMHRDYCMVGECVSCTSA